MTEDFPTIEVIKYGAYVPISREMAMDHGLIPDDRPPVVISRRTRIRWAVRSWWDAHRPHVHLGPCDTGGDW